MYTTEKTPAIAIGVYLQPLNSPLNVRMKKNSQDFYLISQINKILYWVLAMELL